MFKDYLMVHKSILPENYEKVIEVTRMLESGGARDISSATRQVGISRSTYYKYKDYILEPSGMANGRNAVFSMLLKHEPGVLSALLARLYQAGGNVLTITQSLPVHDVASVTISLDVSGIDSSLDELLTGIGAMPGVENLKLLAVE